MNEYIQLKKRNVLKIGIKDENNVSKLDEFGNEIYIEFDLEDIEVPERYSKCTYLIQKATNTLQNELVIINKKQDAPGKGVMTQNEEAKMRVLKKYYKDVENAMDLFLGENGTNKIFGETRYITMFEDLKEMLEPIMPKLKINLKSIEEKIKSKYKMQENDVLKDE